MNIQIFYCVVWNYEKRAVGLAAELKEAYGIDPEIIPGKRGDFEVVVDGELVFSKKIMSRFPEEGEITQLVSQWILQN